MTTPFSFPTEAALDDALSTPTPAVVETLARLGGDLLILGVAGKMGLSIARMARRAFDAAQLNHRVIGVARYTTPGSREWLQAHGVETIAADLLDPSALARLPDTPNILYMAGRKFGSTGDESATWAQNAYLPGPVCQRFQSSRIVAFSTGNIYGLTPISSGGSLETDPPNPVGEYAMSCLGRERIFEYFSRTLAIPVALIRLNYATDLRYGVLVDLAQRVHAGQPIDLGMGHFNTIWQGDANALTLRAFDHAASPAWPVNLTGPETLAIRDVATCFGQHLGKSPRFQGTESNTALLSNAARAFTTLGRPTVDSETLINWVAAWTSQGGRTLNKPTHFESRDGRF